MDDGSTYFNQFRDDEAKQLQIPNVRGKNREKMADKGSSAEVPIAYTVSISSEWV